MPLIDFQQLKIDHSILSVAERLGLPLKKDGMTYRCRCPSGEGGDRGLVITPSKSVFYSFPKQTGGDCIKLVAFVHGIGLKEAAQWIVGDTVPEKRPVQPAQKPKDEKPSEGFRPLVYLVPDHEAVIAVGLDPTDAARLGAGYAPRGVLRGTVAIPVRDEAGKLLGYVGCRDVLLPKQWHY